MDTPRTKSEAFEYIAQQDLKAVIESALQQVVNERADDGVRRLADLLNKAANERENVQRMRELFASVDLDGDGHLDLSEFKVMKVKFGEPMHDDEAQAAFESMGGADKEIDFEAFCEWYSTARQRGGALARKGAAAQRRRQRHSIVSLEDTSTFRIDACKTVSIGEPKTLEFRVALQYASGPGGELKQISPWHDVPLYPRGEDSATGVVHMIVEIPKWSRAKFEIATGEQLNPIKQDVKNGRLRDYNWGEMLFNYGALPQACARSPCPLCPLCVS